MAATSGDPVALNVARDLLTASVRAGQWRVSRARNGWSGRTFVAVRGTQRLFLKFDIAIEPLRRLADLGITPPVLLTGEFRGHAFVIQPFVAGRHPAHRWFAAHLPELTKLVSAYQFDKPLRALISPPVTLTYQQHVSRIVDDLDDRARSAGLANGGYPSLKRAVATLRRQATDLATVELVATHGDPNLKNFVLAPAAFLVDWDDLALSDPLRDVGQLLWWYVPPDRWESCFERLRIGPGSGALDRLFWWVAAESLDVALTVAASGDRVGADAFFDDFRAALARKGNPHAKV